MYKITPIAAALILSVSNQASHAQTGALEEVIVTATKRPESLQTVAVTVNAITDTTLQEAGVVDLADIAQLVPTLTLSTNLNPFTTGIRIRGIGTSQNDPSLEASVAFLVDGVYMSRSGLGLSDLTDIERVEILQGPQGTLYGKNANAGVISVVTKNPNFDQTEGYVEVTAGNYDLQRYTASVTGPITDTVAYRLSGNWAEKDGWIENAIGPDPMSSRSWNMRGKLEWAPNDRLSVLLTGAYVDRDDRCCAPDTTQSQAVLDLLAAKGAAELKNDGFDWQNNTDGSSDFDMTSETAILTIDYDLNWAQLTSLTSWNEYDYVDYTDVDGSELDAVSIRADIYSGTNLAQELRLATDLDGPWQYLAGLYYMTDENTRGEGDPFLYIGEDFVAAGATAIGPQVALLARPGDTISMDHKWQTDTWAAFGQATYTFSDEWLLTLGLRYTREKKDADLLTETFSTAPAANIPGIPTFVQIVAQDIDAVFSNEEGGFTWLANLRHFVTADTMVFAAASTGTKSGGFNGVSGGVEDRPFDEETTINYELGVKSQLWDYRLKLNATLFYGEFDDYQFLAPIPGGIGQFVSNAAKVNTQGIDLSFSALPLPNLQLDGALQYLDAEYTEGELKDQDLEILQAPTWSGSLAATLMLPLADGSTYLRADYSFKGDQFTSVNFQPPEEKRDRQQINLRVGWRNDSWDGSLWVKNATDEANSDLVAAFSPTGARLQFLAPPRTYGATLRYQF